jgi:hypothetical protein
MPVRYGGPRQGHSYPWHRVAPTSGGASCQERPGAPIEAGGRPGGLTALAPAALTLAWEAPAHREQERRDRDRLGQPRLERAA